MTAAFVIAEMRSKELAMLSRRAQAETQIDLFPSSGAV
jgi:hypothetical protein